jgi:hypothetical protein
VLGCGPSGLLAAHAASLQGADVQIFSDKTPSIISGAQYLHEHIPGLSGKPDGHIMFTKIGSPEGYASKVYGSRDADTSWRTFGEAVSRPAWSMRKAYHLLWQMYERAIRNYHVQDAWDLMELEHIEADLRITTLPQSHLCSDNEHMFESVPTYIVTKALPGISIPPNTVIYNGHNLMPWSRASNLFGHTSMEFPIRPTSTEANESLLMGLKPTMHNCDCNPQWKRVGRFGQWKRGVLVHHAFKEVTSALQQV